MPKKKLTNRIKTYYNGSKPIKHCGHVVAFALDGDIYVQCRNCKKWVKLKK